VATGMTSGCSIGTLSLATKLVGATITGSSRSSDPVQSLDKRVSQNPLTGSLNSSRYGFVRLGDCGRVNANACVKDSDALRMKAELQLTKLSRESADMSAL
jgi:hypothetical protein